MRARTIAAAATMLVVVLSIGPRLKAQDVIGAAATNRAGVANGTLIIPVYVKDLTGTLAGRDKPACVQTTPATPCSQISEFEFKMLFDGTKIAGCMVTLGNCTFTEAGILSGVKVASTLPNSVTNPCDGTATTGCSFRAITVDNTSLTYTISTNPPLSGVMATSADPVGDLVGYVSVLLNGSFSGTTSATLEASACGNNCAAWLGGTDTASAETVANGSLTLNSGVGQKAILDLDADGNINAFTDGILTIRRLLGQSGTSLTVNGQVVGPSGARTGATDLAHYFDSLGLLVDVDGDGQVNAFTDGILIVRYLLGQTGTNLTVNGQVVGPACTRCSPTAIQTYLAQLTQN